MYDSTMGEEDGEQESLLPNSNRRNKRNRHNDDDDDDEKCCSGPKAGILLNRILMLLVLVLFVLASVYFQSSLTTLHDELVEEEQTVQKLVQTVSDHAEVIRRFNESVTQADVLKQLEALEATVNATTQGLQYDMIRLQKDVKEELHDTISDLGDTVKNAKEEISQEVEKVKADVDQYVITTQDQFSMENSFMVYQLAGTLTLLSCLISMWHMTGHIRTMHEPVVQRKILAILWMSPIYAVTSWFSLVFPKAEGYLAIIKDGYEAYIIYTFLSFCIAVLGKGDRSKVVDILSKRADHLAPPIRFCFCCDRRRDPYENNPRALADAVLLQCQIFGMQFVFFRPLTTILTVVLGKLHYYGAADGPHDYRAPQFYISIIQNISVFTAFTGLLKFYHAVDKDLEWCRPFAKFLCIKGVVFMTFWQGLAITVLAETTDAGGADPDEWGMAAQNFMICLEMLLFSIAHFYCFPVEEWEPGYRARASRGLAESLALGDFVQDLKLILKSSTKKKKKAKKKPSEPTVPEGDEEDGVEEEGIEVEDDETARTSLTSDLESTLLERIATVGADEEDNDNVASIREARRSLIEALSFSPKGSEAHDSVGGLDLGEDDDEIGAQASFSKSEGEDALAITANEARAVAAGNQQSSEAEGTERTTQLGDTIEATEETSLLEHGATSTTNHSPPPEHEHVTEETSPLQHSATSTTNHSQPPEHGDVTEETSLLEHNATNHSPPPEHGDVTEETSLLEHNATNHSPPPEHGDVTEETSLLAHNATNHSPPPELEEEVDLENPRTKNEEMLQPSIFTTLGDIVPNPKPP